MIFGEWYILSSNLWDFVVWIQKYMVLHYELRNSINGHKNTGFCKITKIINKRMGFDSGWTWKFFAVSSHFTIYFTPIFINTNLSSLILSQLRTRGIAILIQTAMTKISHVTLLLPSTATPCQSILDLKFSTIAELNLNIFYPFLNL